MEHFFLGGIILREKIAKLILEDGTSFSGFAFGHIKDTIGEVIFNTAMTGYQEILTDLSYTGQIVVMTYPLIGNYGINLDDLESKKPMLSGFVVKEKCDIPSNFRNEMDIDSYLRVNEVMGIYGVDTRALTKKIRDSGVMKGIITTNFGNLDKPYLDGIFSEFSMTEAVKSVSTKEKYVMEGNGLHFGVMDFGIKQNILRELNKRGLKLTVFPHDTNYEEILDANIDAVFLSNGPGDPEDLPCVIDNIRELIKVKPTFGICLGHQLIALATGCSTRKMRYGHHGGNHPVKDLETGKIYMSSQNHEYVVENLSNEMEVSYRNVNDNSIEGIKHKTLPVWSVQFHPEAAPGPIDVSYIFDKIINTYFK